jgi:protein SCO1/2
MRDFMTFLVCIFIGGAVYLYFYGDSVTFFEDDNAPKKVKTVKKEEAHSSDIGAGKYKLTNQFGEQVTEKSYRHSKNLVFFGFTHCPDICPTTLSTLTEVYEKLGANADEIKVIFITVDPENDTPEVMQEYLLNFNKDFIGLTGPREEIEKLAKSYKAYVNKSDDGQIMHSDLVYYMDEEGNYIHHFNRENSVDEIVEYIKKHD